MSTPTKERPVLLLDQQLALGAYLNSLLCPPGAPVQQETQPSEPTAVEPSSAGDPPPHPAPVAAPAPRQWAAGRFPCLRFQVAGVTLAVSLQRLNGVLPWPADGVSPMPGHAPWFLGLLYHQGRQVKVIDTAWHVLPPDRRQSPQGDAEAPRFRNIVLIGDGQWGLACDNVEEVMQLEPDAVKWRSAHGRRPWLAGTVIAHMCALLDADAFAQVLEQGEQEHQP